MEIKHKECFCPQFINHFDLQAGSRYAREIWEFVNLYSSTRGVNRFKAVLRALDLARHHPEIVRRRIQVPDLPELRAWVAHESRLGNPQLEAEARRTGSVELERVLAWSLEVNETVARIVRDVPPFPGVESILRRLRDVADVIVVSQTPEEALEREWKEHGIDGHVRLIAGQEQGTKPQHLAATAGGADGFERRYAVGRVLMIGDAPGDLAAAQHVGALFFPVLPGAEERSWERCEEAIDRFLGGTYAGDYEVGLLREFSEILPETPPWEQIP
jgi:phosphoglycolate phosphatase-like HAD superfamily hydrolase